MIFSTFSIAVAYATTIFSTASLAAPVEVAAVRRDTAVPAMVGAPVVFGPGTYPRAHKLSDGSILGVYTGFDGGDNVISTVVSRSFIASNHLHLDGFLSFELPIHRFQFSSSA